MRVEGLAKAYGVGSVNPSYYCFIISLRQARSRRPGAPFLPTDAGRRELCHLHRRVLCERFGPTSPATSFLRFCKSSLCGSVSLRLNEPHKLSLPPLRRLLVKHARHNFQSLGDEPRAGGGGRKTGGVPLPPPHIPGCRGIASMCPSATWASFHFPEYPDGG